MAETLAPVTESGETPEKSPHEGRQHSFFLRSSCTERNDAVFSSSINMLEMVRYRVGSRYDRQRAQWLSRLSGPAYEEANRPIEQHTKPLLSFGPPEMAG